VTLKLGKILKYLKKFNTQTSVSALLLSDTGSFRAEGRERRHEGEREKG
jgi:hypothetical protein